MNQDGEVDGTRPTPRPTGWEFWSWVGESIRPVLGWVLAALGGIVLLLGWVGVSREVLVAKQLPYLVSGGFGGVALVFLGAKLLDTNEIRRQDARLDRMEEAIEHLYDLLINVNDPPPVDEPDEPAGPTRSSRRSTASVG